MTSEEMRALARAELAVVVAQPLTGFAAIRSTTCPVCGGTSVTERGCAECRTSRAEWVFT